MRIKNVKKYIIIGIIIAVIAIVWLIYGDFLLAYIGKKVPEVIQNDQKGQNRVSYVFSLERVKDNFFKGSQEMKTELASMGNIALEKIKNLSFLATAVKSFFSR